MPATKALSASAASRCETATTPKCRCRCGGKMHGAARGKISGLPLDDPHSPSTTCPKCKGSGIVTVTNYEAPYDRETNAYPTMTRPCGICKGAGRIIKPNVLKALKKLEAKAGL